MSALKILFLAVVISTLVAGCTERRANKSLADDYKKCIDKSSNEEEMNKCEAYRKEADAL
jgi:hypothetical protein